MPWHYIWRRQRQRQSNWKTQLKLCYIFENDMTQGLQIWWWWMNHWCIIEVNSQEVMHQRRNTRGDTPEDMHHRWCNRGDATVVMHEKWCTKGDAPEVMHQRWYTRGDVLEVMHLTWSTRDDAPEVSDNGVGVVSDTYMSGNVRSMSSDVRCMSGDDWSMSAGPSLRPLHLQPLPPFCPCLHPF